MFFEAWVANLFDADALEKWGVLVGLKYISHFYPMWHLFELARRHQESHALEATLQLIFRRVSFVVDVIIVVFFVDFSDDRKFVRVLKVE
jgi:hypothetical protein